MIPESWLEAEFRFQFGEMVRVRRPGPDHGATGQVINGWIHPNGCETYAVDVPGGTWDYNVDDLEPIPDRTKT